MPATLFLICHMSQDPDMSWEAGMLSILLSSHGNIFIIVCLCSKLHQLCLTLCDSTDCNLLGSSANGISQARILEWVAVPSSRGSSKPRDQTGLSYVSCTGGRVLYHCCHLGSPLGHCYCSFIQSCLTLRDPKHCSASGFSLHQLPELVQTHDHRVSDAIQLSHPLSSPSPRAFNLSQHQGLFQWVGSSHQVAKVLELQLQHQSFQPMNVQD